MNECVSNNVTVARSPRVRFRHPEKEEIPDVDHYIEKNELNSRLKDELESRICPTPKIGNVPVTLLTSEDNEDESDNEITNQPIQINGNKNKIDYKNGLSSDDDEISGVVSKILRDHTAGLNKSFRERYRLSSLEDDDDDDTFRSPSKLPSDKLSSRLSVNDNKDIELSTNIRSLKTPKTLFVKDDDDDDDDYYTKKNRKRDGCTDGAVGLEELVKQMTISIKMAGHTPPLRLRDLIEQYVVTKDYSPKSTDVGSIVLREGQIVEVIDSESEKDRWLVRTRPSKYLSPRQGWIPISYLEKKSTDPNYISILNDDYELRTDSKEREAALKRRNVVKELVETEEEFVSDMQHVVHTYLREMDNPRMPKALRDFKDDIFHSFKEICEFHNNVLIKGVQYYAGEPTKLGKTFLRLERDFDMHANYCQQEPQAQELLSTLPVREYFEEYSKRIGEVDRSLSDHLKLPIQRINDYQLLLKELIKYTARLKEDCTDLQKALDLMQGIPQRASDLKLTSNILGFKGNIHKLGRLLRHQDWFTVTDNGGRNKERYLFLFKSRIFVTKVRRLSEDKSSYILKDIIKLSDVEVIDNGNDKQFEIHLKSDVKAIGSTRYPLILEAQSEEVKEAWFKELGNVKKDFALITDVSEEGIVEDCTEDKSSEGILEEEEVAKSVVEIREATPETFEEPIIIDQPRTEDILTKELDKDSRKRNIEEEKVVDYQEDTEVEEKRPKVEILEHFQAYEELNTVMTDSIKSGSITSLDANEFEDGTSRPRFRKFLKGQTCLRGETVTMECEPISVPPATVAWLKDNIPLVKSQNVQFVTKGNSQFLIIKDTQIDDSGVYSCKATNKNGSAASSAQLHILDPEEIKSNPSTPEPKKPEFTIKFKDTELLEGTSVRFLVKVRANPDPVLKFFKNDKPLKEDDRIKLFAEDKGTYELSIAHVTANDAGKYTCKAKNNLGESEFSAAVKVTNEKELFHGVQDVPVQNGNSPHPGDQPDFRWFRDGLECEASERFKVLFKDEEDTLALVFQHVKPEDAGLYTCVASTTSGRISCSAELSVEGSVSQLMRDPEPPKITAELSDVEVGQGTSAMLELKVTGYPKPAIEWSKDGNEIKAGSKYKVLHEDDENMALIIKNIAGEDAGKYTVKAKNPLGEVSSSAKVVVKAPPKFVKTLEGSKVMADQAIKFDVEIEGDPKPEVVWYKDGQVIKENERIKITESSKTQSYSLEIKKSRSEDAGSYSCVATNSSGKISEFAHVTVNEAPKFLKEIKSVEIREFDNVKFEVKVAGQPEPSVKWMKGNVEIKEDGKRIKFERDDRNYTLIIEKASRTDADKYSCIIKNEFGDSTGTGNLTVNSAPEYVEKLNNMTVKEGDVDYKLQVKVSGFPEPKIRWFIESMEIDEKSNRYKIVDDGETKVLVIKKVDAECSGSYSCKISNSNGEASCEGTLNVLTKPRFVEGLSDLEKTEEESVSLTVKVTGNPSPSLKWYKDSEEVSVSATVKVIKIIDGCSTLDITKLVEEAAGTYECHASNTEGDAVTVSKLIVNTNPRFIGSMESVEVWSGEDAAIECQGTSIPFPEVKWFKNGELLEDDSRIKIKSDGDKHKVSITNTAVEDSGAYKCVLSNKIGTAELEGKLNVKASAEANVPVLLKKLEDIVCIMGENGSFQAKIYANPEPEIKWYRDGVLLEGDRYVTHNNNITHFFDLTVKNVSPSDIGKYTVVADNGNGKVSSEASMDVNVPPVIQEIKDKKAMPESSVTFETKVTGKPIPAVKWVKGTQELTTENNTEFESDEATGVYKLKLKKLTPESSGGYACVATNVAAEAKQPFNLTVTTEAPHFIKGLQNKGCKLDGQLKIDVQVYGLPMPLVKWFKDKNELTESDKIKFVRNDERNFSLIIEQFVANDAGKYTCKAINQAGEAVSQAEYSLHHGLPEFVKQLPKEVCVMDGEPLVLEAKVDTHPMPEIKWLKDGKEIVPDEHIRIEALPDGTVKLTMDSAVPEDKGKFTLLAINDAGQTPSTGQVVVEAMPKAPKILKNLENQDVPLGSQLKLAAKVTAYPKPTVKWLKDGKPLKLDNRVRLVQHNGTLGLEIDDVRPEDEGKYTLQVSNHRGEASSSCDVTAKSATSAPEVLQPLKLINATEGTPCRLEAKVSGIPLPTCNWFKDGEPITPDDKSIKSIIKPDGSVALIFDKCALGDAGKYTLEAINPYGSSKCDGDLNIAGRDQPNENKKAPFFTLPLRDVEIDEGKPLKLSAQIEGNPYPDISWTKDDLPLRLGDNLSMYCDGNKINLEIPKSSPKDSGRYECKLSSPEGNANSKCGVNVRKIYSPPIFTQKPSDLFTILGGDPRFICRVGGIPKPDVTWFFNDHPLHDSPKYKIRRDGDLCALQIKASTPEDKGRYKCRISNDAGEDHAFANLDIGDSYDRKDKFEAPSFLKKLGDCSIMEGMSAKFTACVAGIPEPEFRWYMNGRELKDTDRIKSQVEPHGLLRLLIKSAKPEDVGSYTLKIWNPHGEIESAAQLIFDQFEEKKLRKPKPDLNLDLNKVPPVPSSSGDDQSKTKPPKSDDDDGKVRSKMADLNIDREKFRRQAIPFALTDKPIISKMTDRRLTLSWKPSIPRGPSVPVTYIVDMCEVPEGDWISSRSGIRGCCCEIRNLEPFRDYKFRVRVENKYGISDASPYALTFRQRLEMTPPRYLPRLPPELDFRPETSPYFPRDYDIDRPLHEEYAHAPKFLRQIDDIQYGVKGEPCTVEWYVYGFPVPTVEFTRNGQKIEIKDRYESAVARNGQCKLYISRMFDHDVGEYECIAKNEHGEARQRINLAIAEHPVFIMPLDEESILIRKSGYLQCRVVGKPYPEIKWYKDWRPLASSSRIKIEWKEPDLCTLYIDDTISKDGGLYSCCARNIAGMATSSAMLTIEEDENDYALIKYSHARDIRARTKAMEDFYDIGDELGRGTQGIVYHAVERSTGNSYAAKCMHGKGDIKKLMHQELDIMNQLHDRYLIRARDAFETKNAVTILTDLAAGGELFDTICKQTTITESEIANFIRQILWGLDHMHNKGIAHLGLSPADILLSKPGGDDIKICDFGLARRILKNKDIYQEFGMPEFVAPEIINRRPVGYSTDMWSVGVITYLLLSGISPFLGETDRETLKRIQAGQLTFDQDVFSNLSDEAKDFISKLLVFDSQGRMDIKTALSHPWLRYADRPGSGNTLSTDRLRDYYRKYKDWIRNSACDRFYRRRPLTYAFDHPSGMVYPPGEKYTPASSPESSPTIVIPKPEFEPPIYVDHINENDREPINYDLGYADSNSRYQNGPDTYLLQLRDVNFPLRLREYMRVAGSASPSLGLRLQDTLSGQMVTVRERRRFTDVMDEEIDDEKKGQLDGVRRRISSEVSQRAETKNRIKELLPREEEKSPYFREKIRDTALTEGNVVEFSCLAIGEPKPVVTWYRNDVVMTETHRVKIIEESDRSILRFNPAKTFDAGFYKVVARNIAGEVVCRARLKQGELPGKADALEAAQVSDTEALITWHYPKADGNSPVICYCLEFKESDEPTWREVRKNIDHQCFVVRSLSPKTNYSFRLRAQNQFGWGDYSNSLDNIVTLDAGSPKVSISCAMKHQQELTESNQNNVSLEQESRKRPLLDYSKERNPVPMSENNPADKYRFISEISKGKFSVTVKCCLKEDPEKLFAAKLLQWSSASEQEYDVIKSLSHEGFAFLESAHHFGNMCILVMEKLQGCDVITYLTRGKDYTEDVVARITAQVLDALEYLHFRRILHLDVQPDNVVVSDLNSATVKLVDLGSAQSIASYVPSKLENKDNVDFLAPEVLSGEDLSTHADIWSLGVLTYILLSGVSPFKGENTKETTSNINYVRYRFENLHKEITQESQRFLMAIFKKTPIKRPTADECQELKWLTPSEYMLKKREKAIFNSEPLKVYNEEYRRQKQTAAKNSEGLMNAFGMQLSRSVSVEYQTMTTF